MKLLKGLNPSKALSTELGPIFAYPLQQSIDSGDIP